MYYFKGVFAGIPVTFGFRYKNTEKYFTGWLQETDKCDDCITIPEGNIKYWERQWKITDYALSEYAFSCGCASDYLMKYDRIVFHGAAFMWDDKAYIFTAPSGTGKTTQLNLWKSHFEDQVTIINGDKPILEVKDTGIIVHPSPWKGKEGMGTDKVSALLGGIIILKQAMENTIEKLDPNDVIRLLFGRFYSTFNSEYEANKAAYMLETILNNVPVWLLRNKGDSESFDITRKALKEEMLLCPAN